MAALFQGITIKRNDVADPGAASRSCPFISPNYVGTRLDDVYPVLFIAIELVTIIYHGISIVIDRVTVLIKAADHSITL